MCLFLNGLKSGGWAWQYNIDVGGAVAFTSILSACSDHEFIQQQETYLLALCQRTMALPVGRCCSLVCVCICYPMMSHAGGCLLCQLCTLYPHLLSSSLRSTWVGVHLHATLPSGWSMSTNLRTWHSGRSFIMGLLQDCGWPPVLPM